MNRQGLTDLLSDARGSYGVFTDERLPLRWIWDWGDAQAAQSLAPQRPRAPREASASLRICHKHGYQWRAPLTAGAGTSTAINSIYQRPKETSHVPKQYQGGRATDKRHEPHGPR
ncbi:hypothetical protein ASE39_24430 [Acidovorax sp. Root267]|uniref:FAD-binding oxidoreductase n=1 Tax=Acidovorax sp. Root267 TaxID=1736505 RepID=UPI00070B2EEA|nr:FAD-binding oxidoreductase [Acidovorax sp. Root267]KRD23576.1 hypothetical protein ASE39_24430 [Acidovorax sp. Root267]